MSVISNLYYRRYSDSIAELKSESSMHFAHVKVDAFNLGILMNWPLRVSETSSDEDLAVNSLLAEIFTVQFVTNHKQYAYDLRMSETNTV